MLDVTHIQKDVVVLGYSETPPDSGYLRTWIAMTTRDGGGNQEQFLVPYMGKNTFLPKVGVTCDLVYQYEDVEGLVGLETKEIKRAKVIKRFENIR